MRHFWGMLKQRIERVLLSGRWEIDAAYGIQYLSGYLEQREAGAEVVRVSRFYTTPAFPPGSGADYVNAAAAVASTGTAQEMLDTLHGVEAAFGRVRGQRWGARILDLDLLAAGDTVLPTVAEQDRWRALPPARQMKDVPDTLILPHPRLQDRAFVLVPLNDVAPGWVHPRTGRSVAQMLAALPEADRAMICPLEDGAGE